MLPGYNPSMPLLSILFALSLSTAVPPADLGDALCTPRMQIEQPAACPAVGPGMYAAEFAAASLPAAVPELPLAPLERYDPVVPFKYAKVVTPEAPVFASPAEGVAGTVARTLGSLLEFGYRTFGLKGEPRLTRFLASELALSHYYDISRAKRDFGYRPQLSLEEAVERTVAYFKQV